MRVECIICVKLFVIICFTIFSCKSGLIDEKTSNKTRVNFQPVGDRFTVEDNKRASSNQVDIQKPIVINPNDDFSINAALEAHAPAQEFFNNSKHKKKLLGATYQTFQLEEWTDILIYVYKKSTGELVDYTYVTLGHVYPDPIELDGGHTYTVVAYGYPANNVLYHYPLTPLMVDDSNISTAKIEGIDERMIFNKEDVFIGSEEQKTIPLILRNIFSGLHVTLVLDPTDAAIYNIKETIASGSLHPHREEASLKVSDETVTYSSNVRLDGSPISWLEATTTPTSKTSNLSYVISPEGLGQLLIDQINIGPFLKSNVTISNLKLTPGVKYDLVLNIADVPRVVEITDPPSDPIININIPDSEPPEVVAEQTVVVTNANYGALLDLYFLDNAFSLEINGESVTNREIEFEGAYVPRSVAFPDGSQHGQGADIIYYINESRTERVPIVRMIISSSGTISFYGRKNDMAPLEPLTLINGTNWESFTWNSTGTNTLKFTSSRATETAIIGKLTGLRTIL